MIKSLLIANRGEIACRIIRTARRLGIRTVAVYSDADASALHVRQADEAVHIGPSPARESYLVGERIIAAARATGAQAIHPGYGFLSENAEFAQAVIDAGLIWVGPNPDSIRAMGLKDAAKARMIAAGVPVTPGYLGDDQSPERLQAEADAIGYPVLIKAVAGGGGKGMRQVNAAADFPDALQSCRREAASSFGDDRVLIEKYILSPRHIEVQVFGDTHGQVVHLFERDCSLQRRHQKVIEEAPAPGMDEATRQAVCAAAVKAAKAVNYVGAGTIEFIADASEGLRADRIWFMEMNTRLQVEHPVTEEITGQDLVEWQLRVASGEPLPKRQEELRIDGWAMEARLYAEDPLNGFLPSPGSIDRLDLGKGIDWIDALVGTRKQRLRIDAGVEKGDVITTFYDPMIAKIIVHHDSRNRAMILLREVLASVKIWPLKTNAAFLHRLLSAEGVRAGTATTALIEADPSLRSKVPLSRDGLAVAGYMARRDGQYVIPSTSTPKGAMVGFRLNGPPRHRITVYIDGVAREVPLEDDDRGVKSTFALHDGLRLIFEGGQAYTISLDCRPSIGGAAADGAILSPMPGRVIAVEVAAGDAVTRGQKLVTLEAMKMEHSLTAPFDGTVAELSAVEGGQVSEGAVLARVEREA